MGTYTEESTWTSSEECECCGTLNCEYLCGETIVPRVFCCEVEGYQRVGGILSIDYRRFNGVEGVMVYSGSDTTTGVWIWDQHPFVPPFGYNGCNSANWPDLGFWNVFEVCCLSSIILGPRFGQNFVTCVGLSSGSNYFGGPKGCQSGGGGSDLNEFVVSWACDPWDVVLEMWSNEIASDVVPAADAAAHTLVLRIHLFECPEDTMMAALGRDKVRRTASSRNRYRPGFGDDIKQTLESIGVNKLTNWLFPSGCGCDRRRQWLNRFPSIRSFFPWKKKGQKVNRCDKNEVVIRSHNSTITPGRNLTKNPRVTKKGRVQ